LGLVLLGASPITARERLVVWGLSSQNEWDRGTQVITEVFEKRHDVEISTFSPGGFSTQKILSAIVGGTAPDVLPVGLYAKDWVGRGVVRPLDDLIARDRDKPYGIHLEDYYEASLEAVTFEGQMYALPDWAISFTLYYNKDILTQAGLVDEAGEARPPATWEEWFEQNRVLTRRDDDGSIVRTGGYPGYYVPTLFSLGKQLGARFISPDGRTCTMTDPVVLQGLQWLTRYFDYFGGRERLDAFRSSNAMSGKDPFYTGVEAMRVEGQWYITNFARFGPDVDYGVSPVPQFAGQPRVDFQITTTWGIPHGAEKPELAWEFLKWITSREAQEIKVRETIEFTKNRGHAFTPFTTANRRTNEYIAEKFVRHNPIFPEKTKRAYDQFVELLETATHLYPVMTPVGQLLRDELVRATDAATLHRLGPEEALARGQRRVQDALDQFWGERQLTQVRWPLVGAIGALILGGLATWVGVRFLRVYRPLGRQRRREALAGMLFVSPWAIGFTVLLAGPVLFSIVLSFTRYSVLRPARWVGLDNYVNLLTQDPLFFKSLLNTVYMMMGIPLNLVVGLSIAMLLNKAMRGISVYRTIYYLPSIVPAVASAILWVWIFHPNSGLMNTVLAWFGVDGPLWLHSETWAKPAIIVNGLWGAGGGMIIWLAGLKGIPEHLYEAAEIDGATWWGKFRYVTVPMLTPYIFFNLIMGTIGTLQIFTQAVVMTKGGPLDATLFYVYYLFNNAFEYFRMGYASAMAWILFIFILILTLIQLKLAPRWVHYESETKA